jgi:hypothetical protein
MEPTTQIPISAHLANVIKKGVNEKQLTILLNNEIPEIELRLLLQEYKHWSGLSGVASDKKIISANISKDGTGWIKIEYQIEFTFGCSNQNAELAETAKIYITTDFSNNTMMLKGEYQPERLPDDI